MNKMMTALILIPLAAWSVETSPLDKLLETAAEAQGDSYLTARNGIVGLGTNALPLLVLTGNDMGKPWQQRLVARICYERLLRGRDIDALCHYNWRNLPGYDKEWENSLIGPGVKMTNIAVPYLASIGLWYHYIEMTWKTASELAPPPSLRINEYIPWWGRKALADQIEHDYLCRAMTDRLAKDVSLERPDAVALYQELIKQNMASAIPALLMRCEAFYTRTRMGIEMHPGENDEIRRAMVQNILNFADSRHADMLEKYISEKPALEPLKKRLAEVRTRPAPPPVTEPPFRLGTNAVMIVP